MNASVGNGGTLSHVVTSGPSHGTLNGSGLNVSYIPQANYSGPHSFTYKATYGAASSDEATVSITVTPQRCSKRTTRRRKYIQNTVVNIAVLANDVDVDGDQLSLTTVTTPANGSVSVTGSGGVINYRPRNGFTGIDSFSYTVSDGRGGMSTATVTVNVTRR